MLIHNVGTNVKSYLETNGQVILGTTTIWSHKSLDNHQIYLYFDKIKHNDDDIVWDGNYPEGYFNH
ncbi:hypothetical protein [Spiroplasma endosymbiont of Villa modesta]|uniref:hypothetical protein n=1 Tax=Spiroplasma endosymbiont of Villa modesta TaxID=3066293 RepID=UPI00313BB015